MRLSRLDKQDFRKVSLRFSAKILQNQRIKAGIRWLPNDTCFACTVGSALEQSSD
jgi:hypothetical protein